MLGPLRFSVLSFVAAFAAWLGAPAPALAAPCPAADVLPRVSLQINSGRVVYNTRTDRRQLRRLQGQRGGPSRKRGWHPIGLTLTELKFRMKISINTLPRKGSGHCATVGAVEAELGFGDITVYVDKRYRKGSCQYRSVIEHENEHVAIFRSTLDRYAPRVEGRLTRAAEKLKPVAANTPNQAAERLQKTLKRQMEPLFKEMNRALDSKNNGIDTAANYKREQARCSKW
jgi:hypothetical protein